jgi:hypothetical protein
VDRTRIATGQRLTQNARLADCRIRALYNSWKDASPPRREQRGFRRVQTFRMKMTDCRSRKPAPMETPKQCFDLARLLYAGVMAEHLFDKDFREGSSLDEVIASQVVGAHAANLIGMIDQAACWQQNVHQVVGADLVHN